MSKTIKMDPAGRVVIPRDIREKLGLGSGSHQLDVEDTPEGIVLRPKVEEIPVERHSSGWIVFRSGGDETGDPIQAVEESRAGRQRHLTGDENHTEGQ